LKEHLFDIEVRYITLIKR